MRVTAQRYLQRVLLIVFSASVPVTVLAVFWPNSTTSTKSSTDAAASQFASCVQTALVRRNIVSHERAAAISRAFDVSPTFKIANKEQSDIIQQVYAESIQADIVRGCASSVKQPVPKAVLVSVVSSTDERPLDDANVTLDGAVEPCSTGKGHDGRCQLVVTSAQLATGVTLAARRSGYVMVPADAAHRFTESEFDQPVHLHMRYVPPLTISITQSNDPRSFVVVRPRYAYAHWSEACEQDNRERSDESCLSAVTTNGTVRFYFRDATGTPIVPNPQELEVELIFGDKRLLCALDENAHADWETCKTGGKPSCESRRASELRKCDPLIESDLADCVDRARRHYETCRGQP